jgi:hypothetical protein
VNRAAISPALLGSPRTIARISRRTGSAIAFTVSSTPKA